VTQDLVTVTAPLAGFDERWTTFWIVRDQRARTTPVWTGSVWEYLGEYEA